MNQCPKGHYLSSCSSLPCCHVCGGDASVCMTCTQGCIHGICQLCMNALKVPPTSAVTDGVEPCSLGVSPAFLKAFKAKWSHVTRGWTTGQVCHQLVKPLTCRSRASMCEDLMRMGGGEVGPATLVLSHCWENLFEDTVDAALEAVEGDSFSEEVSGGGGCVFHVIAGIMMIATVVLQNEMNLLTTINNPNKLPGGTFHLVRYFLVSPAQSNTTKQRSAHLSRDRRDCEDRPRGCGAASLRQPSRTQACMVRCNSSSAIMQPVMNTPPRHFAFRCMLELYSCVRSGGRLHVALTPSESDRLAEHSESDAGAAADVTAAFSAMLSRVNTRGAVSTLPQDQVR